MKTLFKIAFAAIILGSAVNANALSFTEGGYILVDDGPLLAGGKGVPVDGIPGAVIMPTKAYGGKAMNGAAITCQAVLDSGGTNSCTVQLPQGLKCEGYFRDGIRPISGGSVTLGGDKKATHFNCFK